MWESGRVNYAERARGLQDDVEAARAFISGGQPRTEREIDYHVSELEAGTPVAEAEMAVGISFQAIALAFVAALLAVPEAPMLIKVVVGLASLTSMVGGAGFAIRAVAGVYARRALLHELHALRRDVARPARPWWKRLLG